MDLKFLFILLGIAAAFILLALLVHSRKESRRKRISDPRRDHVYHEK